MKGRKKIHRWVIVIILVSGWMVFSKAQGEALQEGAVSLEQLIQEAREGNPSIKAARSRFEEAREKVIQAGWLDDPMASYTWFGEELQTRVGPQEQAFGINQKLPFPTKLYFRAKAARREAQALEETYHATEFEVLTRVKQAYYELFWIRKALEITEQDKALLERLEQVARAHFAAHAGPQQDVFKAQVEISRAIDRLLVLRQREETVAAHLNSLLDRPEETRIGTLEEFSLPELSHSFDDLQRLSLENRQELRAADHRIQRDKAHVALAKWRYVPDFAAGVNYIEIGGGKTTMPNDGEDAWGLTFAVNVPIWQHTLRANLKEAEAKAASSEAVYEATQNQAAFEVSDAHFQWQTAKALVDLYQTAVIPQAEQALDVAESAYRVGEADFLNLLDSERVWLNTQLTYWRAYADAAKAVSSLERATGVFLSEVK